MRFRAFHYPSCLEEARTRLLSLGERGVPVAGATAFHFLGGDTAVEGVSLHRAGLAGIRRQGGLFQVGPMTTLREAMEFRDEGWVLRRVARQVATCQLRNISTVGGNLVRVFPWSDLPAAVLLLEGTLVISGEMERQVRAADFFASQPARQFAAGELLTRVDLPALPPGAGFAYRKQMRVSGSFSTLSAGAIIVVRKGVLADARVAVGTAMALPCRLPTLEAALADCPIAEEEVRLRVQVALRDLRLTPREGQSADYTRHLAQVTITDATMAAAQAAGRTS